MYLYLYNRISRRTSVSWWRLYVSSNKCLNNTSCYNLHRYDCLLHAFTISHANFHFFLQKVDPLSISLFSSSEDFPLLFLHLVLKIVQTLSFIGEVSLNSLSPPLSSLRLPFGAVKFPSSFFLCWSDTIDIVRAFKPFKKSSDFDGVTDFRVAHDTIQSRLQTSQQKVWCQSAWHHWMDSSSDQGESHHDDPSFHDTGRRRSTRHINFWCLST
jgi:hypothetical protein